LSEDLAGLGIWLVGYPAPKTNWGGIALALPDRADNILARLLVEPRLAKGNIIFVVHSLGGLVVEQLLRSADRDATSDSRAEEFLSRVRRIAFLGTPHRGAILANVAVALRLLLLRPSAATRDLLLGSPQLRELNRWYRKKSQTSGIEHLVLAEGRPEKLFGINLHEVLGKIVWSDSADPGLPELSVTVDESHTNICKPASKDAEVYVLVKEFIVRPFAAPRMEPMAQAVESNTRQLKQLTTQSQEQTMAIEAFKRTVEDSIYLRPAAIGKRVGTKLLEVLLEQAKAAGVKEVVAVISYKGAEPSIALHERFGFKHQGHLGKVGFKFGRWLGTVLMQKSL